MATDAISRFEIAPDTSTAAPSTTTAAPAPAGGDAISRFQVAPDVPPPSTTAPPANWLDPANDALNYGRGLLASFQHGFTFGLDRPINALSAYLLGNTAVGQKLQQDLATQKDFEAQHPIASTVAETAGSIPTYAVGEAQLARIPLLRPTTQPGVAGFAGNLAKSAARNVPINAALEAGTAEGDLKDRIEAAWQGAITGGIAGPVGDIAGRAVGAIPRAVTGGAGGASAADADLARTAITKYNIPITAPDLSSNPLYRIAGDQASNLPFSGARPAAEAKLTAWRGAIANEMGATGKTAFTPDVMKDTATRTGQVFDDVAARTNVSAPEVDKMTTKLADIEQRIDGLPVSDADKKTLHWNIDNIVKMAAKGDGTISGADYQAMTHAKGVLSGLENATDSSTAHLGGEIRDALDDAFDASASQADQDALRKARYQWRIMKTVEPLAAESRGGEITPDAFMRKVLTASRRFDPGTSGMAYTGGGNIGELARIGKLMRAAQQTGSGDRMLVNLLATGGVTGGVAALTNPVTALSVPGGLLANNLAQRYLNSRFLANRVIKSSINPPDAARYGPWIAPLTNALASGNIPIQ